MRGKEILCEIFRNVVRLFFLNRTEYSSSLALGMIKRHYVVHRRDALFLSESSRLVLSFREDITHTMASNSLSKCRKQLRISFKDTLTSD